MTVMWSIRRRSELVGVIIRLTSNIGQYNRLSNRSSHDESNLLLDLITTRVRLHMEDGISSIRLS